MRIQDVENMTADELKAKGGETVNAISSEEPQVLATRYVQARLDAKRRDMKLAEQAKTIEALRVDIDLAIKAKDNAIDSIATSDAAARDYEENWQASEKQAANAATKNASEQAAVNKRHAEKLDALKVEYETELATVRESARQVSVVDKETLGAVTASLNAQTQRADRLKTQAEKYTTAISSINKLSLDAINSQLVDNADTKEA